jgi:hypothetical protein
VLEEAARYSFIKYNLPKLMKQPEKEAEKQP